MWAALAAIVVIGILVATAVYLSSRRASERVFLDDARRDLDAAKRITDVLANPHDPHARQHLADRLRERL